MWAKSPQADRAEKTTEAGGHRSQAVAEADVRHRRAHLLSHDECYQSGGQESWTERECEQRRVAMIEERQESERCRRPYDGAEGIHHAFEAERATVRFSRDRSGEQRLAHRRPHAASEPGERTRDQDMPGRGGESERRSAECGNDVSCNRDSFAPLQSVGVVARCKFRKTRQAVGYAFDQA